VRLDDDPGLWVRRLSVVLWAMAGVAMATEAYRDNRLYLTSSCLLAWLAAFTLCGVSLLLATRQSFPGRSPRWWAVLLALQAASIVFMVWWYQSVAGAVLLVPVAWQAASVWPLRRALAWVGLQTIVLGAVMATRRPQLMWLMVTLVSGVLQLFVALVARMVLAEAASRLELAKANDELRSVQDLLARSGRTAERLRVARELHDGMGHRLTALSLTLEAASHQAAGDATRSLGRAQTIARDLLHELRGIVGRMREEPPPDIREALDAVVRDIESPRVHLTVGAPAGAIDPATGHTIVRCVQELVTNAIRHSHASNVWIDLERSRDGLRLDVRDDGCATGAVDEGNGLRGMRERVTLLGGRLDLAAGGRADGNVRDAGEPAASTGFRATIWLPGPGIAA
jgi:signal transduction histidine kinase